MRSLRIKQNYALAQETSSDTPDIQVHTVEEPSTIPGYEAAISQLRGLSWRDVPDENTSGSSIMEFDELIQQREFIDSASRINDLSQVPVLASPLTLEERRAKQT